MDIIELGEDGSGSIVTTNTHLKHMTLHDQHGNINCTSFPPKSAQWFNCGYRHPFMTSMVIKTEPCFLKSLHTPQSRLIIRSASSSTPTAISSAPSRGSDRLTLVSGGSWSIKKISQVLAVIIAETIRVSLVRLCSYF